MSDSYDEKKKVLEIKVQGELGTGNTFVNIGTVQNYVPNATTVVNYNNYSTKDGSFTKSENPNEQTDDNLPDIPTRREELLRYVQKTLQFVIFKWKAKYMELWNDILDIDEVKSVIYEPGRQVGPIFNRKEMCHIICYLGRYAEGGGIFEKYNATHIANSFADGGEKTTRPELGARPVKGIQVAIDGLMKQKKYV